MSDSLAHGSSDVDAVSKVLRLLELEPIERDHFIGNPGEGKFRLFGGLVAAQSVMAAGLTVEDAAIHSLHAYFLRPGSYAKPIRFMVDRIRDGRTFTTRRVVAYQDGEAIFNLAASFAKPEPGPEFQEEMPDAPQPEDLELWEALREKHLGTRPDHIHVRAIEIRVSPREMDPSYMDDSPRLVWMRPRAPLPDDPLVHAAFITYASDRTLIGAPIRKLGLVQFHDLLTTSLDHAMWFHKPPRFDDWVLYTSDSPAAGAARGLALGGMYQRDGTRFLSVAQEGLLRKPR